LSRKLLGLWVSKEKENRLPFSVVEKKVVAFSGSKHREGFRFPFLFIFQRDNSAEVRG
jgi:hypothetical protein